MTEKLAVKLRRGGQKIKHGGYAFLVRGQLPEDRRYIKRYLSAARANLIKDLGPTEADLTAAQIILIDRIITKLGVVRCMEEHVRENTVMKGDQLAPCLRQTYLTYNESIRRDLVALGIKTKAVERGPSLAEIVADISKKKRNK